MDFQPQETYSVVVSYDYNLGGYPELDFNAKRGELEYYLAPAAMWKDFSDLTIRLYLDQDMPVLVDSSLPLRKWQNGNMSTLLILCRKKTSALPLTKTAFRISLAL